MKLQLRFPYQQTFAQYLTSQTDISHQTAFMNYHCVILSQPTTISTHSRHFEVPMIHPTGSREATQLFYTMERESERNGEREIERVKKGREREGEKDPPNT